jgi:predicted Zn-ribbon and HTH transcriptional regulator
MVVKRIRAPAERSETFRTAITSELRSLGRPASAKEISALVGLSEKEVLDHLTHIRRSGRPKEESLALTPAACKTCGFVFRKRERLTRPTRCPMCKGERIAEPHFSLKMEPKLNDS